MVTRPKSTAVAAAAVVVAAVYIAHPPAVPDLAAQVARVDAARSGAFLWWTGWFGGVQLPAYSALSPLVMAGIGVGLAAALAALTATVVGFSLCRDTRRPLAGAAALSVSAFADIFAGRVTFALGAAAAICAVELIRRRWTIPAAGAGLLAFLFSPLAGLFLGMIAFAVALTDSSRRRAGIAVAATLAVAAVVEAIAFPGQGQMPYPWWHMAIAVASIAAVGMVCPNRTVRVTCVVVAAGTVLFFLVPSPVGTNIVRMTWLAAAPTVAAMGQLRRLTTLALVLALAVWPAIDLGVQLDRADSPAAHASFYAPVVAAWRTQAADQKPQAAGERVEVINTATQWAAAYVAPIVPMARGWDRPTDRADNALFYNGTLTNASYHAWLLNMSVGWVALPRHVPLDYASVAEAAIVQSRPAYLRPVWHSASWDLYRVRGARPLVHAARLVGVNTQSLTFFASAAGTVDVRERWSPYLRLLSGQHVVSACIADTHPWTRVTVPAPGTYTLAARFDPDPGGATASCPRGPSAVAPLKSAA